MDVLNDINFLVSIAYLLMNIITCRAVCLLVITEEDLDRKPTVTANLEAVLQVIELVNLLSSKLPAINVKVALNARLVDRLGNNTPALLDTPDQQNLLRGLALLLSELQQGRILVERGIGRAEAGVTSGVDTLGRVVGNQLGGGVVGVKLDLVDSGDDLGGGVVQKDLEVLDAKVGDTDVADLAGGRQLLHLLPGLDEVPVWQVLGLVVGVGRAGPVDQVQIDVVDAQVLEGGVDSVLYTVVPGVVQLGGDPDLVAWHTRVLDAGADLGLVAVGQGRVDVSVALEQGILDSLADLIGLGLPGAEANGGDLVTGVEGVGLPIDRDV